MQNHTPPASVIPSPDPSDRLSLQSRQQGDQAISSAHFARLEDMTRKAIDRKRNGAAGAANSQRAYDSDIRHVQTWLRATVDTQLPMTPGTLFLYLSDLADQVKWATLNRRLASIVKWHKVNSYDNPASNQQIQELLTGIRKEIGTVQKQAPAFDIDPFKRLVASLDEGLTGLRDKSMLLIGFAGAFRRSELVNLDIENLTFNTNGLLITYYKSKTNKTGGAEHKGFFYSPDVATCPVRTLQAYVTALDRTSGPLFVRIRRVFDQDNFVLTQDRLSDRQVSRLMKTYFGADFSAHSLRASFVTIAKLNDAADSEIMQQTGHKTTSMIRRYTRINDVMKHNAGKKLGL